jgi:hypothetical protein
LLLRATNDGHFAPDIHLLANGRNFTGRLFTARNVAFFANIRQHLVAFFFADGCECVAQADTGLFAKVDQDLTVKPQISGKGENSNLQNTNPLG